ncbi:MAG: hypothetical protein H7Y89_02940 [Steroidobacteraceae bacterium]|nr:hypothetical protein [Steroidobacteraceae bacterium]
MSLLAVAGSAHGEGANIPTATAALRRLGVVTHLDYRGTPYENLEQVRGALSYIGLDTLRDMTPLANKRPYVSLAEAGFRFSFVIRRETVDELPKVVAELEDFARRHPHSIVAIEGLNEIKYWPASYRGDKSFAGASAAQCELYALVNKPASNLSNLPVLALTLGGASQRDHDVLGDLSDCADVGNAHIYFGAKPPASSWGWARELSKRTTARKAPLAVTETGYSTIGTDKGVPEDVQARYLLFLVSRALREDVPLTFIYQLVDDRNKPDWSYHLGLYRHDWTPKPAAHAFHHFTQLLRGDAKRPQTGKRAALPASYVLGGDAAGVESLALLRDDGSLALLLWREVDLWDPATRKPISPRPRRVTLTIDAPAARIGDSITGEVSALHTVKSGVGNDVLTIDLVDRPLIVLID